MADKISITICGDGGCEDSYSVTRTVDGLPYFLSITDTAGQEEYRGLWTASTLKSDAFLLVYDITNPSSLQTLDHFMGLINMEAEQRVEDNDRLRRELGARCAEGAPVGLPPPVKIVAGNKCDLKNGRAVPSRDGLEYARKHGCGFMETSARDMVNIEETFALLVRRVVDTRRVHQQQSTPRPPPFTRGTIGAYDGAAADSGGCQCQQVNVPCHIDSKRGSHVERNGIGIARRIQQNARTIASTVEQQQGIYGHSRKTISNSISAIQEE
ncbi:uncharacterized protein N7482_009365 [Penicillium canariense]|uniref:Small GTPase superfamily, Rho type n=1 Tax=Penicillium canariense TaxID=189055 RepID=A0A9W9LG02_9EURO|nr:uncharacterized protein N7482_009365 [Penicillium canariense]KAJ5152887.1 hypothetical protein N7482_009365 [Penicillium canariense]